MLLQVGLKRSTLGDRIHRLWDMHCRGLLSDTEAVVGFLDNVAPDTVETAFDSLSPEFQSLISNFVITTPCKEIRTIYIGPENLAAVEEATLKLRATATALKDCLTTRCTRPPQRLA